MATIQELGDSVLKALQEQVLGFGQDAAEISKYLPMIAEQAAKYGVYSASPDPVLKAEADSVLMHLNVQTEMIGGILAEKGKQRLAELVGAGATTAGRIVRNLIIAGMVTA